MVAWGIPAAMIGSSLISGWFGSKNKTGGQTVSQGPMWTPEQNEAMQLLLGFGKTGQHGGYTAGESYGGPLGNYNMSALESGGQNKLMEMLNSNIDFSGLGGAGSMGKEQLQKLFDTDYYDPYSEKGVYKGFEKRTNRQIKEAQDKLKQNMAFSGDLYSTATAKESGLLQERGQDIKTNKLAELFQNFGQQKLNAIPQALRADQLDLMDARFGLDKARTKEGMEMGRIGASQQYGGLQRMLDDLKAKDMYSEWQRSHNESKEPLKALQGILGSNTQWGAQDVTVPGAYGQSPWAQVFSQLTGIAGNAWIQQLMSGNNSQDYTTDGGSSDNWWADA